MEAKQYATKQPMDHWRNQRKFFKIHRDKRKWKHNDPKPMGCGKAVLTGKFIEIQSYLMKK